MLPESIAGLRAGTPPTLVLDRLPNGESMGRPPCGHCGEVFPQAFPINSHVPLRDRLFQKVHICQRTDCWIWMGRLDHHGYGQMSVKDGMVRAHRVSFELHNGPIPDGMKVRHTCDNQRCVRPTHLELGAQLDNIADRVTRQRSATGHQNGTHTRPEAIARGERNGQARLTEATVLEIRGLAALGWSQPRLARHFGVGRNTIWAVLNGVTWRHVP
jgi:hypothetical protein